MTRANGQGVLARVLLLLAAMVVGALASELLYRGKLWMELDSRAANREYSVLNKPLTKFDADFGYSYAPGESVLTCQIRNGAVHSWHHLNFDQHGNLAMTTVPTRDSVKVLIFGDSFTTNPNQPLGWPHFFAEETGFEVHNFARDGYGLIQMIHLAAAKSRELHPDLIIVAFIMEDLVRARTWRSTIPISGHPTPVTAADPILVTNPATTMETALIDPQITPTWCQQQQSQPNPRDPTLTQINQRYQSLFARRHQSFLLNPRQSLLLNRLKHQDPYQDIRTPSLTPLTPLTNFEDDATFVRDLQSIQVPMLLIVLPKHNELLHQKPQASKPMISLIQSLQHLSGISPKFLMTYMDIAGVNIETYYLLPEDQHPSVAGSAAFARGVVEVVRGAGVVK